MTTDMTTIVFSPIYTLGHWVGEIVAILVKTISGATLTVAIIDTIGLLAVLTIILLLADVAKKLAWGIVTICWALIIMRIGLLMIGK